MRVAVTDNFKQTFENYVKWLKRGNEDVNIVKLSYLMDNLHQLDRCDGLVLTGGGDVDPHHYHGIDLKNQVKGVDTKRDDFEFRAIERALSHEIPTLGICRGLQVTNVAFGGSLILDLVSSGNQNHRQTGDEELLHPIQIERNSQLARIVGGTSGEVNSAHHQAADTVGKGLKVSARSLDDVVEALEWADPSGKPFLLLIQWHPERMKDFNNPSSHNILQTFLSEVQSVVRGKNQSRQSYHDTQEENIIR